MQRNAPRRPSRSGRQEGAVRKRVSGLKASRLKPGEDGKEAGRKVPAGSDRKSTGSNSRGAGLARKGVNAKSISPRAKKKAASGYNPIAPERVQKILAGLDELYPGATCALTHRDAWELLVATILSAQCTDVRVNMVTPILFEKYPSVARFAALDPEQLQPDIRSTGFFRNKSKSLVGAARKLVAEFGGEVPKTMDELLSLPGVARKTANVVLGTWFRKNIGLVVDTHVTRISRRLELTKHEDAPKIEDDLMGLIPQERWTNFSHQVIWHGRKLCLARSPKCAECLLEPLCHAAAKTWSTVEIHPQAR